MVNVESLNKAPYFLGGVVVGGHEMPFIFWRGFKVDANMLAGKVLRGFSRKEECMKFGLVS